MDAKVQREFINPSRGFTHVVKVRAAGLETVYVSGQVGWKEGEEAPGADLAEQAEIAWSNLARQLAAAGADNDAVVKLNVYIKNIDPERVRTVGRARGEHFPTARHPAATWVGVTGLVHPQLEVEIEATAVVETR